MSPLRASILLALLPVAAFAQNLQVLAVPWDPADLSVPHQAYNGRTTTFKAIARGGDGNYTVEWDFNGDDVYEFSAARTNRYDLSARFTFPNQPSDRLFAAKVRVTSNGQTVVASYPVRVFADVPLNPGLASQRQLQVMRNVALDDALWFLHNQMTRSGSESDPIVGAQITGRIGSGVLISAYALELLGRTRHYPAFPAAYLGTLPDPAVNAARWANDPYAEDAARLLNFLLEQATAGAVPAADESNATGFYPEVTRAPLPGTDDGICLGLDASLQTAPMSAGLRAISLARVAGYTAQTGDVTRVRGRSLEHIVQQLVDCVVWAQNDGGSFPGSWYYSANQNVALLTELGHGSMDAFEALMIAERTMGPSGVVVPNFAKARAVNYVVANTHNCPEGGTGGTIFTTTTAVCDFAASAAHVLILGWMGANTFGASDSRVAFPGYFGLTRAQLRALFDSTLVFITNTFLTGSPGMVVWDTGFVEGGDFTRVDGRGNIFAMWAWSRAARSTEPELTTFGLNDLPRLFSRYLVNQQANDGSFNWQYAVNANHDSSFGNLGRTAYGALALVQRAPMPVVWPTLPAGSSAEGASIPLSATSTEAGGTFTWDFGGGLTRTGQSVTHAFPDNGFLPVTLTHTSASGAVGSVAFTVTVTNAPPVPSAGADRTVEEGTPVDFAGTFTDPGAGDTHSFLWTFTGASNASTANVTRTWNDDQAVTATFRVTDDDGASAADGAAITVVNVKPTITSTPGSVASVGAAYSYTLTFTDPGAADTHACSAPVLPAGATLTNCTLSWTPQAALSAVAQLCVTDDDGGQSCQTFPIFVGVVDSDADGLPDSWEQTHFGGLAQTATQDGDADGLNNAAELAGGTSPTVFDGPGAPAAASGQCGITVSDARPTMTVTNATDPQADALRYDFEVYADAALTQLDVAAYGVPAGAGSTSWRSSTPLAPGQHHWRARAHDGHAYGAWSSPACAFTVPPVNQLPGAPTLSAPAVGSKVATLTPALEVGNAVDPDGDALTYEFEIFRGAVRVGAQANVAPGSGTTAWTVAPPLVEDGQYTWRARAVSAGGAGPWSATGSFGVNTANTAPPVPALISPQNGTRVGSLSPRFSFLAEGDADGDALTFDWELAADDTFAAALSSDMNLGGQSLTAPSALTEDERYCWRVRSDDGQATSAWAHACFVVSAEDGAPTVPTPLSPAAGLVVPTRSPVFSWSSATDPEGAPVTYDLEVSQGGAVVASLSGVAGNAAVSPLELADGQTFTWRVRASAEGASSDFSAEAAFEVKVPAATGPAPTTPQGCGCAASPGSGLAAALLLLALRRRRK